MYIFNSFYLLHSYHPSFLICLRFNMVSFRGQKKLGPRPNRSPLGVLLKISDEHSHPFRMRSSPPRGLNDPIFKIKTNWTFASDRPRVAKLKLILPTLRKPFLFQAFFRSWCSKSRRVLDLELCNVNWMVATWPSLNLMAPSGDFCYLCLTLSGIQYENRLLSFFLQLFPVRCPVYRKYCINMTALGCNYCQESMETTDNRIDQLKSLNIESANTFLEENANSYGITNTLLFIFTPRNLFMMEYFMLWEIITATCCSPQSGISNSSFIHHPN